MVKRGFIYGTTGLFFEILWTGLCSLLRGDLTLSAHTAIIMLPVYGLAVFLEPMFYSLAKKGVPLPVRGLCYALMFFVCEYFSGKILNLFGICPWRYSGIFSIEGVIRLDYAPLWFAAGLVYERLYFILSPTVGKAPVN